MLHSICQQIWKTSSGHRTGKAPFHFNPKELPDTQAGFRKGRGTRDHNANIRCIIKKKKRQENSRKTSALLTVLKPLTLWITANCGKFLREMGTPDHWHASWEICMPVKKQQLEKDMEQLTGSKLGKDYVKVVYCQLCLFNLYASSVQFSTVQSFSRTWLFATPWTAAPQASLSITNSWNLLKLMSIESVMPSSHLILSSPLFLPSILPSIRVFSKELVLRIRWPKYWRFSFSINTSNEYPGLISFRMDWLDLLAVQGTLKSLLQHHSSKAPILQRSAFFIAQPSHPYLTTDKTIALT